MLQGRDSFSNPLSHFSHPKRCYFVNAQSEVEPGVNTGDRQVHLETIFSAQFDRIARVIACVVRDHARAEELAVEVFLKWWRSPGAHGEAAEAWLYRSAVHMALDELRRQTRRARYERLLTLARPQPTPEDLRSASEEQNKVRSVLAAIPPRQAELLVLRSNGFGYAELAASLGLNPASVGTLLSRAQQAFRKEFIKRYGKE
jgi:RNA polymerase sigma-70 factor (ECF subfamily)